jgi:hypothetical protein
MVVCLGALALLGLIAGIHDIVEARENPTPTRIAIQELEKKAPAKTWLDVTGGTLLTAQSVRRVNKEGLPCDEYVALSGRDERARVVLHVRDRATFKSVVTVERETKDLTDPEADEYVRTHKQILFVKRDVRGLLRAGGRLEEELRANGGMPDWLAPDFLVLEEGDEPARECLPWLIIGIAGLAGLAAIAVSKSVRSFLNVGDRIEARRRQAEAGVGSTGSGPVSAPGTPPEGAARRERARSSPRRASA